MRLQVVDDGHGGHGGLPAHVREGQPVQRNDGGEKQVLGKIDGEAAQLAGQPGDGGRGDDDPEKGLELREGEFDAEFLGVVNEETMEGRKDHHHKEEEPVESVVAREQVAILHLVEHQEAVVLADYVIVGPDANQ